MPTAFCCKQDHSSLADCSWAQKVLWYEQPYWYHKQLQSPFRAVQHLLVYAHLILANQELQLAGNQHAMQDLSGMTGVFAHCKHPSTEASSQATTACDPLASSSLKSAYQRSSKDSPCLRMES